MSRSVMICYDCYDHVMMGIKHFRSFTHSQAEVQPVLCIPPFHLALTLVQPFTGVMAGLQHQLATGQLHPLLLQLQELFMEPLRLVGQRVQDLRDQTPLVAPKSGTESFSHVKIQSNLATKFRFPPRKSWRSRRNDTHPPVLAEWPASDAKTQIFASQIGWPVHGAVYNHKLQISTGKKSARISRVQIIPADFFQKNLVKNSISYSLLAENHPMTVP